MRSHHIIHVSAIAALLAVGSSAFLAYSGPTQATVVVTPPAQIAPVTSSTILFQKTAKLGLPMTDALDRVTKKPFGIEIHPKTSPVQNDRFDGFHVGTDFETTEAEADMDVPISAICDGEFRLKGFAKGYGGYALQSCKLDGQDVIVLYGHLHLATVKSEAKQVLKRGDYIGMLGKGYSKETDGVRKHLHLGVHRGADVDIRGYVPEQTEIGNWLDVIPYLKAE